MSKEGSSSSELGDIGDIGQSCWRGAASLVLCEREPELEAVCQLGRLTCVSANSWTSGQTTKLCMKSFLGFTLG